jgi:hypothetical protein
MNPDQSRPFKALSQISVPKSSNTLIINWKAAVQLGKAFSGTFKPVQMAKPPVPPATPARVWTNGNSTSCLE